MEKEKIKALYFDKVAKLNVGNLIKILSPMRKPELFDYLMSSNTLLLGLKDHPAFALTIPSKVFDYLAMNRPIVAMVSGEAASLLRENPYNKIVPPEDGKALTAELVQLINGVFPSEYPISNHSLLKQTYTREKNTICLEHVLERASSVEGS